MHSPMLYAAIPAALRSSRPRNVDAVFASRRRMILSLSVPAVLVVIVASIVFSHTHGPEAVWIVLWWMIDLLVGGSSSIGLTSRAARVPLLSALVVTGTVAVLATFVPADTSALTGTDGLALLVALWSAAIGTACFRVLIPFLLPKRTLRVVTERETGDSYGGSRLEIRESSASDPEAFVSAILDEVRRQDIELVELTFSIDAEVLRELSWKLRDRDVELYLPLLNLGVDPGRVQAMSATNRSGVIIAPSRPGPLVRAAKRLFDFIGAVARVVVFSPILAAVAIAIKISMPGPVFYTQERIGLDGRPFRIIKFRSMIVDADAQLSTLLVTQGTADQPLFKVDSDPRVTRLGQILRRSSLDELPQLFNVIGGSMSLVGPRPQRDGEVALYRGSDHHRLGVRPGMTGLWQVSGRSDLGWDEAREFDLYYAHNWNLKNDLAILLRTFGAVARAAGAR